MMKRKNEQANSKKKIQMWTVKLLIKEYAELKKWIEKWVVLKLLMFDNTNQMMVVVS
jgi:hypothetical protein